MKSYYNYQENVKSDVKEWIAENIEFIDKWEEMDRDDRYNYLNDVLWVEKWVTGNGSEGSPYSDDECLEMLAGNWKLLKEAAKEFSCGPEIFGKGPVYWDMTIRCYLLGECIDSALDDLEG